MLPKSAAFTDVEDGYWFTLLLAMGVMKAGVNRLRRD
jgi:hypothetical protein